MTVDIAAAADFMAAHARLVDRHRFELVDSDAAASPALAALEGYRNPDGGFGWGLEPDLRSPESQPAPSHHAFEVLAEVTRVAGPQPQATGLCDWLDSVTLDDGGLPMALPMRVSAGSSPFWVSADPRASSLQITSFVAAAAHVLAVDDQAVAGHPWLGRATEYCIAAIERLSEPFAYVLAFSTRFADALGASRPDDGERLLARLRDFVPADGNLRVTGGTGDEMLHPLDLAPYPDGPARTLFTDEVIEVDLDRLAGLQQSDGGWVVDYESPSPRGALDWRGYATVGAIDILRRNGRIG
jgi:hypothetical protein